MIISRNMLFLWVVFGVVSCGQMDGDAGDANKEAPVTQLTEKPDNAVQGVIVRTDQHGNVSYVPASKHYGSVKELRGDVENGIYDFQPIDKNYMSLGAGLNFVEVDPGETNFELDNRQELAQEDGSNWWWSRRPFFQPRYCGGSYLASFSCFYYPPVVWIQPPSWSCVNSCFSYQFYW